MGCFWACRRRSITKAIEKHAVDVDVVDKLLRVLADAVPVTKNLDDERLEVRAAQAATAFLDAALLDELAPSCGVLMVPTQAAYLRLWLALEVHFRPDQRSWIDDLRDRLVGAADRHEIDLRELDI